MRRSPPGLQFYLQLPAFEGAANDDLHLLNLERLAEKVVGASVGRLQGDLPRIEGGHDNDRHIWSQFLVAREQVQPIPIGQSEI